MWLTSLEQKNPLEALQTVRFGWRIQCSGKEVGPKKEERTGPRVDSSSPSIQEARLYVLLGIWKTDTKHIP